ncbi:MAG: porin family protein [Vicinamibacterales bacterium]|nr:porin family protein [Vicinamibacterales bacterium]
MNMKTTLLGTLAIAIITIGTASQAHAQGFISPLIGYDFGGDAGCPNVLENCEDAKLNISVSFGAIGSLFGFEEEFAYAPNFLGTASGLSSSTLTLMSNVLFIPKLAGPVRPYVLAGLGLIKTKVDLTSASVLTTDSNNLGWDVGGGLMVFVSDHFGLRGDLRYFHSFQDLTVLGITLGDAKLNYGRLSGGAVLTF